MFRELEEKTMARVDKRQYLVPDLSGGGEKSATIASTERNASLSMCVFAMCTYGAEVVARCGAGDEVVVNVIAQFER